MKTEYKKYKCIDHKGNGFNSLEELCDFWGLSVKTFNKRIRDGLSLKDALELGLERRKYMKTYNEKRRENTSDN